MSQRDYRKLNEIGVVLLKIIMYSKLFGISTEAIIEKKKSMLDQ